MSWMDFAHFAELFQMHMQTDEQCFTGTKNINTDNRKLYGDT